MRQSTVAFSTMASAAAGCAATALHAPIATSAEPSASIRRTGFRATMGVPSLATDNDLSEFSTALESTVNTRGFGPGWNGRAGRDVSTAPRAARRPGHRDARAPRKRLSGGDARSVPGAGPERAHRKRRAGGARGR
ncbi:hypothetical protein Sme01_30960 [Sphaerisporangium melleum]|uniref:Uncharacterized protein n=1 Tax=Sphaerisporangium melleum TaxID=321316 RepID=A0A917VL98_9ACTN|nr:hypothetical protein GCM10007964_42390 [Sphaerisporangium melleum]GII70620.1 hypothetical protein Sme01_30960 [Sphaerisporangium melleum]